MNTEFDDTYFYFTEKLLPPSLVEQELSFIVNRLGITKQQRILDLPCGYGRYSNILAEKGYMVTGVDINASFLKIAKDNALKKNLEVSYLQQDMRSLDLVDEFDHILCLHTSWGYFDHNENMRVLEGMSGTLAKGGYLFIELMNPNLANSISQGIHNCTASEFEGNLLIDWRSYDSKRHRFVIKRLTIKDGVKKETFFEIQNYSLEQMQLHLKNVGLKLVDLYGGQKGRPYNEKSYRMVLISQKE